MVASSNPVGLPSPKASCFLPVLLLAPTDQENSMEHMEKGARTMREGNMKEQIRGIEAVETGANSSTRKAVPLQERNMVVEERIGDLFSAPTSMSLAHCISKDVKMSAGIALAFRRRFGGLKKLRQQQANVGEIAILGNGGRFIYYLVTKERYFGKPTMTSLHMSLEMMCKHMVEKGVKEVAMPRIGCGLDRMNWGEVKILLEEVFNESGVKVIVYNPGEKTQIDNGL